LCFTSDRRKALIALKLAWLITISSMCFTIDRRKALIHEKQNMSKPLKNMTVEELSQYMKKHQDNSDEWQRAYDLFAQKSDWQDAPQGSTWEEQKQFVTDFVSQVTG
jgi:hypothetical protein